MLGAFIRTVLQQRLIIVVLAVLALGAGIDATRKLSVDAFPDVTNIQVQVATVVEGRSPDEVERLVTVPVEITMTGLPGLTELRSQNQPGLSIVTLVFNDETPLYFARQIVMERLGDVKSRLPEGIYPELGPVSTALSEVYQYTIESPKDGKRALTKEELVERRIVQDWVARPLLRNIPGVAEINSTGGYVKQYQVLVDPIKLRYYGVTIHDVHQALARNNANSSGGILSKGPEVFLVRGVGLIRSAEEIGTIVLKEVKATPVLIRDVAEVKIGEEVRVGAVVKGGYTESVGGIVMMIANGNAKRVVELIKARVAEINAKGMLPNGLQIVPYYDRSLLVDAALNTVSKVLLEGMLLVVVILFLFLGDLRSSIIVIATLVLTPALTFLVMNHYGISANLMSLGGMAIAIGLMIDGSVVVVENVFDRLGKHPEQNRLRVVTDAVLEVATPVIFGICIIILVFLPLMTLEGMEGKMFAPLAYTIAIALAISLVLSMTISPVLSAYLLKGGGEHDTFFLRMLKRPYLWLLGLATRNEWKTICVALLLFGGTIAVFPYLGTSFIPEMKEGTISPNADRAPTISLDESIKIEMTVQNLIKDIAGIDYIVSRLGRGDSPVDPAGYYESDLMAQLKPEKQRQGFTQDQIAEEIRKRIATLPGINPVLAQPISDRVDEMVTGVRADVAVKIFGDDLDTLVEKANEVARVARKVRGTGDVKVDRMKGQQNLTITIDRQAIARFGLNASDVHDVIEAAVGGKRATQIFEGERRFDAVVRFPEALRNSIQDIQGILLTAPNGAQIPLGSLTQIEYKEGASQIKREMAKRRIVTGVNVRDRDLGTYVQELQERVNAEVKMPPGYYIEWGGQFDNMQRAKKHLMVIVPITIGAIFFLLFLLFRSVKLASLIILVLPFASIGGVAALFATGEFLSVPASVGFIALWGIAVLNGVVLVSNIHGLREAEVGVREAIVQGATSRFRPVMMTATVAALGLVPFLFATGPGSEVQRPLAIVVIGGLITSTLLTLLVVPAMYRFFDDGPKEKVASELNAQ
ncbi:efflux RND transporter permease subunit [Bryobacter aggregatus]|uniref:efflux RND transporter permease subunit n=1 Tax=Bryobacter aggregatus TaxID=360054 RepID=UPI0004E10C00|nr:CusA/CzcA family heavy metal efflux RND transporter [Bryobacter aggregatus]